MKSPIHPKDIGSADIPGYIARPPQRKRKPAWYSRILGSMVQDGKGDWSRAPQLERGPGGLQEEVEAYLEARRIPYFRIPDLLFQAIAAPSPYLPIHWKKSIADYVTDWPDFLIPHIVPGVPFPLLLALELKSKAGKQSKGQKLVGEYVACRIARTLEEAIDIIDDFMTWKPKEARA